jgi:hypothetical protein
VNAATAFPDRAIRWFVLGGLALVLLLRAAIPVGWMPSAAGGFAVTLCTGTNTYTAWMDADGKLHREAPGKQAPADDAPCAFAAVALAAPAVAGATITAPMSAFIAAVPSFDQVAVGRGLVAPPPPSTGPPSAF